MKYKKEANCAMFGVLPKENAAILDFYLKDCCFDTQNKHHLKRASPCFYSQYKENEERPLKSRRLGTSREKVDDIINDRNVIEKINGSETDSVVSSSGSCSTNSYKPYDMYCRSDHDSDAESACQSGYHEDDDQCFTNETFADEIHRQELNAYRSTIEALHASGPLTWEKETMMRAGYGRSLFESLLPLVLGRDVSGEVAAVGASVRTLNVGQEVFGALHPTAVRGTYADYAVLAEDQLTPKPSTISHVEASAIPFAALTAWRALKSTARITKGQRVLVIGGGGAVGFSAIQLAVATGCVVSSTCESESIERLLAAGAEQALDYTAEDLEVTLKGHYNAVLDTIGIQQTEKLGISLLKRGGHYMTLQGESAKLTDRYGLAVGLPTATAILLKKQMQYRLSHGIEYWWTYMRTDAEGLDEIRRLTAAGKLKVPVEKTFPITQVCEAHDAKDKRIIPGKVVLEVD